MSGRIARWILLLYRFNYKVVVKSEKANSNTDFLSRQRGQEVVDIISANFPDEFPARTTEPEEVIVIEKGEQKQVMCALHSSPLGGHFAPITTVNRIISTKY